MKKYVFILGMIFMLLSVGCSSGLRIFDAFTRTSGYYYSPYYPPVARYVYGGNDIRYLLIGRGYQTRQPLHRVHVRQLHTHSIYQRRCNRTCIIY